MIQTEDLHRSFDGQTVLQGVHLRVAHGEMLALIGRSGGGKSVLMRHMMGLMKPDRGKVLIEGMDIHKASGRQRSAIKERFGVLFQGGALFDSLSVFDNVAFPLRERKDHLPEKEIRERVMHELEQVDLQDAGRKFPAEISGGMKKRVALARAIVHSPQIVFFDEPTTGLDPITSHAIHELIGVTHRRLGFTAMLVTHEVNRVLPIADRVALLHEGRIAVLGTPDEFVAHPHPVVRAFLAQSLD